MRGHNPIIEMRKRGIRPEWVHIYDAPFMTQVSADWHNPGERFGEVWVPDSATVEILDTENIQRLDLRFVTKCKVQAGSHNETRAKQLFEALQKAGASFVICCHSIDQGNKFTTGWTEVWRDNNG